MPPLWGLGFWHRVPAKFSADEMLREVEGFAQHDIPLDVIGLEPGWQTKSYPCTFEWQKKRFPDPAAFTKELLDDGIRLNLWVNPYISKPAGIYEEMEPLSGSHLVWLGIVPDYTLPEARRILLDQHKRDHFDIGVSGYKIDEVDGYDFWLWPDHATFPSGTSVEQMRQTYGLLMQEMIAKDLYKAHNRRTYSLVRASNGAASNYRFALYSDSYGHGEYITGLSSASLSGILWCPGIRSAGNSREWINRMHTVCFSPIPMLKEPVNRTRDIRGAELQVRHYGEKRGSCLLYEDDGDTCDFENGKYRLTKFTAGPGGRLETEMLKERGDSFYGGPRKAPRLTMNRPPGTPEKHQKLVLGGSSRI